MLRIGCAQSDITPPLPVLMGGAFLKFECRDVLDPVMASCVVADDGKTQVALVSCDLGSVCRDMCRSVREQVHRATRTPGENIFISATHNHSGPTVQSPRDNPFGDAERSDLIERTRQQIADDIAACVIQAHENFAPARMGYGRGRFESGGFNRRFIMSNGRSRMHGGGKHLERLKAEGPTDPEVQAVWFEDAEGRCMAVMVSYAAHPTNFYGKAMVSADFPGVMRDVLQGVLGKDVPVLYLQGACGNIMCQNAADPQSPHGMANAQRTGRALAGETLRIMGDHTACQVDVAVSACRRSLEIPYRDPPIPFEEAREKWAYFKDHWDEFLRLDIEERGLLHSTLRLEGYKREAAGEEAEIAAFALGDVCFVTNPAELFVEFQLAIKARFKGRKVIVTELTNGRISYVPTRLACALGGYETIITRFGPGAGELIRDASCELIEQLVKEKGKT